MQSSCIAGLYNDRKRFKQIIFHIQLSSGLMLVFTSIIAHL